MGLLVTEQKRRALLHSMAELARRSGGQVLGATGANATTGTSARDQLPCKTESFRAIFPSDTATPMAPPVTMSMTSTSTSTAASATSTAVPTEGTAANLPVSRPSLSVSISVPNLAAMNPESPAHSPRGSATSPSSDTATDESIMFAVALLRRLQQCAETSAQGEALVKRDEVDQILQGFSKALESVSTTWDEQRVEDAMQKLFQSHANVFDESMQNFFIQNYLHESDCAKTFRTALRRTSMLRRCLLAMYPTEKASRSLAAKRWSAAIASVTQKDSAANAVDAIDVKDPSMLQAVKNELSRLHSWNFNVFLVADAAPAQVLTIIGKTLLEQYDFCCHFRSSKTRLYGFLRQIEQKYHSHPYHNAIHASDVTQTINHFMKVGSLGEWFSPRTKCAALLAAIIHDVGHTSYTNNFHIAINDDLAIQYVYRSPLEHMHCALAFQLLRDANYNILDGLTKIEQLEVRNLITDMVLATDNSVHSAYLAKLESLVRRTRDEAWKQPDADDEKLILQMALHAADVSNPAKLMPICKRWARLIKDEFYLQGDKERELMLPVSVGYDRRNPIPVEKLQAGFIIGIVRPLFAAMSQLPNAHLDHCVAQLDENLSHWQREIERNQPKPPADGNT